MTATPVLRRRAAAALIVAIATGACSRDLARDTTVPGPRPSLTLAALGADTTGRDLRALTLVDGGAGLVVGSFRVAVRYDTSRYTFAGSTGADTLSVALHDAGGRVVIAGASARGFATGEWIRLGFAARHPGTGPASLSLDVLELGDLRGGDLRARVAATPQSAALK